MSLYSLTGCGPIPCNSCVWSINQSNAKPAKSILAAASMLLIREKDLNERVATGLTTSDTAGEPSWTYLLRDPKQPPFGYIPPEGIQLTPPPPPAAEPAAGAEGQPAEGEAKKDQPE